MDKRVKKVVLLCTALNEIGGTSRHMAKLYKALDRQNFCPWIVFSSTNPELLKEFFEKEGCKTEFIRVVPVFVKNFIRSFNALRRLWLELKPDIIHSFFLHSDILSWLSSIFNPSIVRISSVEGKFVWDQVNGVGFLKHACYSFLNKLIRSSFTKTITVSADLRNEVIKAGAKPNAVMVVPVGLPIVDVNLLKLPQANRLVVGCISRFSQDKGVDLFLRAIAICAKDYPDVSFTIAGAGQEEKALIALASQLGIANRVHFQGWVEDVTSFYNSIDIFVMPSRREGCPLALIEAMMHQKAIVVFDAPGVNEVINHEQTGLVAAAFEEEKLASHIVYFLKDEQMRFKLGSQARKVALEKYSISSEIALIQNIYLKGIENEES